VDSECPTQVKLASIILDIGGSRPEMVFQSGSQCGGRDLSTDYDLLRVAQLTSSVGHTRNRFRFAAATVENIGNRLAVRHTPGTAPNRHPSYERLGWQTIENDWTNFTYGSRHLRAAAVHPTWI